jgi:hypothetical protein
MAAACAMAVACGPRGGDVFHDINSEDTGPWLSYARTRSADGALLVHVGAARPDRADAIARHIVAQMAPLSVAPIRIVVDPASRDGQRHVYRWDGRSLSMDHDASGLPPPPSHGPATHGEPAAH